MTFARKLALASTIVVALVALIGFSTQVQAYCENCYVTWVDLGPENSYQDAQCCLSGSYLCNNLAEDGWTRSKWDLQWCSSTWINGLGWVCNGDEGCSSGGLGGGGGDVCSIVPGGYCPAECPICIINYY